MKNTLQAIYRSIFVLTCVPMAHLLNYLTHFVKTSPSVSGTKHVGIRVL